MGDLRIQVLPRAPAELAVLETDFMHKERGKEIARARRVLIIIARPCASSPTPPMCI